MQSANHSAILQLPVLAAQCRMIGSVRIVGLTTSDIGHLLSFNKILMQRIYE